MVRKLPEYYEIFKEDNRPVIITAQIEEHFVRISEEESGFDILLDSLRNIPFELLRYTAEDISINLSLKYYGG